MEEEEREFMRQLTSAEAEVSEESSVDDDEPSEEATPSNTEMRQILHRLRIGLETQEFGDM